ncbi:MAG: DUF928 domain-containing protein [Cyanothece sp. SIO1E1]|nr:DUF928 domain-containing protein [Cyanothece sp. SIO1E1]
MHLKKYLLNRKVLASVLSPALILTYSLGFQAPAYSLEFPPTGGRGAPGRTIGGGIRGDSCIDTKGTPLTALMPGDQVAKTVTPHPTFFWYVPETTAKQAEFFISDESGNKVYQGTILLAETPGVLKMQLPETSLDLETNQNYYWEFAIICDPLDRTRDAYVQGMIQRTELNLDLQTRLGEADLLERAQLYAKEQIWQDTLTIAAQLWRPNRYIWVGLLNSVGLDAIAQEPLVDCCQVQD